MRHSRAKRGFDEDMETKKLIYISIAVVVLAILTFTITYIVYSRALSKNSLAGDISKITELSSLQNEQSSEANTSIGKSVNEVIQNTVEESNKIAINTSAIEENIIDNSKSIDEIVKKEEKKDEIVETKQVVASTQKITKVESIPDPTFIKPVDGEIIKEYAKERLVYSNTLKEWITHTGIDIKAEKTTIVKASSDGKIKYIKNDPRYGITVIMEHVNGYTSIYSNLLTAEFVKEGEEIKQGQTIGTVGNTAAFEILDDAHLHFEILKDNENVNPSEYIK